MSTLFNARYGWGAPPCQGPNSNMNCHFFRNYTKGMTQGKAHGLARDFQRNESFTQMSTRWAMYTNTLQGDPTMAMWRTVPADPVVDHPASITAMPQQVYVEVYRGATPLRDARVAITHQGELVGRAVTGALGGAHVPLEVVEDTWTLKLTVTGQDIYIYEEEIGVTAGCAAPLLGVDHWTVDDFNGRLDPGDEADIYFVVKNSGNAPADTVRGQLWSFSPFVTVLDSYSWYGDIAVGDTAKGDVYRVRVAPGLPAGARGRVPRRYDRRDRLADELPRSTVGVPHARQRHLRRARHRQLRAGGCRQRRHRHDPVAGRGLRLDLRQGPVRGRTRA